jgi:rhodanese-related sulfurtransferase
LALKKMGYQNVASMEGGMSGWAQTGYPVLH